MKKKHVFNKVILIGYALNLILCFICSIFYFHPIYEHVGWENRAYKWLSSGETMEEEILGRLLCMIYSYILAMLLLYLMWYWIVRLFKLWNECKSKRIYVLLFLILSFLGILTIIGLYPTPVSDPPDTAWNYVYAREFLPMYWHGFLTNVVHCACMIIFPHPVAMSIIPFLLGITGLCYILYQSVIKNCKHELLCIFIFFIFLLSMPETVQVFIYAGRNYHYALLSVCTLGIFLVDYMNNVIITKAKILWLSFLICFLACWRGEGIAYLVAFPFMLYGAYYQKNTKISLKKIFKSSFFIVGIFLLLRIPDMYGSEKYQGDDYIIINLPGPLSAVWANNPNTNYKSYEKDMEHINTVININYIIKYADMGSQNYNWDNLRISRQSDAGENGKAFIYAAYDILFHNLNTFLKYQFNVFAKSLGVSSFFKLNTGPVELYVQQGIIKDNYDKVMDYTVWHLRQVPCRDFPPNHQHSHLAIQ